MASGDDQAISDVEACRVCNNNAIFELITSCDMGNWIWDRGSSLSLLETHHLPHEMVQSLAVRCACDDIVVIISGIS